ncbi:MAG: uncharacterized protein K0R76_1208 [Alphaproteobacteria bacterium]|nr:uncharacterized protein [Alphaproteobacteria bacterium]MDF3034254.1 uncharacterized protein [Alphaproteobacteria bacterium]
MNKKLLLASTSLVAFSVATHAHLKIEDLTEQTASGPTSSMGHTWEGLRPQACELPVPSKHLEKSIPSSLGDSWLADRDVFREMPTTNSPSVAGVGIEKLLMCAQFSGLAYVDIGAPESDKLARIENLQSEGNRVQFFGTEVENSGLIITNKDGHVSVVYKGSSSLHNWATDAWANFAIDDQTGLRCHNGIMKGFYRTQGQVFAILEQIAQARGKTIQALLQNDVTVTGHSLGGGLSQMFMAYAHKAYDARVSAVTFAAPRVFDVATAKGLDGLFHEKYLNVMQVTDPVPGIALGVIGYKHFGTKLHLPYAKEHWQHIMKGYQAALEQIETGIKVGSTEFKYEESSRTGIGNAKWIGNTSIPNPAHIAFKVREATAEHVDPVIHRAVKAVKDGGVKAITTFADTVKTTGSSLVTNANKLVSSISTSAKKLWGSFWR